MLVTHRAIRAILLCWGSRMLLSRKCAQEYYLILWVCHHRRTGRPLALCRPQAERCVGVGGARARGGAPFRNQLIVFLRLDETTREVEMRASPPNVSALLLVLPFLFPGTIEGRSPNVLLVMADDLRYFSDEVPRLHTPNYDALAARGVTFENAFAQVSILIFNCLCYVVWLCPFFHRLFFVEFYLFVHNKLVSSKKNNRIFFVHYLKFTFCLFLNIVYWNNKTWKKITYR